MDKELIDESLDEEKGLQELATGILMLFSAQIKKTLDSRKGEFDMATYSTVSTGRIDKKYQDKLGPKIHKFWSQLYMKVSIVRSSSKSGVYVHAPSKDGKYDFSYRKEIKIFTPHANMQEICDEYNRQDEYSEKDAYFKLYYIAHSILVHELRHAYDDMRTGGKIFKTKKATKFFNSYKDMSQKISIADEEEYNKAHQKRAMAYINLPHEIWARASQAMDKVRFVKIDLVTDDKGELVYSKEMHPMGEVLESFRLEFDHWRQMSEKVQKRLYKAVANAWHEAESEFNTKQASGLEEILRRNVRSVLVEILI
jgi:hypothetical protein